MFALRLAAYAARWDVEQTLRYSKSELGIESVRVRDWEPRRKLLALSPADTIALILRWAHRTGRQANERPL